jgi:hypothetical protein
LLTYKVIDNLGISALEIWTRFKNSK